MLVERIRNEYIRFKEDILNKSKEEIYNSSHKIRFFENIYYYVEYNSDNNETIKEIEEKIENLTLEEMYKKYQDTETFLNVENGEDIAIIIEIIKKS
jgi:hypothetical protein